MNNIFSKIDYTIEKFITEEGGIELYNWGKKNCGIFYSFYDEYFEQEEFIDKCNNLYSLLINFKNILNIKLYINNEDENHSSDATFIIKIGG